MKERGGGRIINVASMAGLHPPHQTSVSGISEAGGIMLAQVLACELGEPNIQVNLLVHGPVQIRVSRALWQDAELMARYEATVPLRRVGKPEDVAGETLSLASSAADWVTGGVLVVEGVATPVSVV